MSENFNRVLENASRRHELKELIWRIYQNPEQVKSAITALQSILDDTSAQSSVVAPSERAVIDAAIASRKADLELYKSHALGTQKASVAARNKLAELTDALLVAQPALPEREPQVGDLEQRLSAVLAAYDHARKAPWDGCDCDDCNARVEEQDFFAERRTPAPQTSGPQCERCGGFTTYKRVQTHGLCMRCETQAKSSSGD